MQKAWGVGVAWLPPSKALRRQGVPPTGPPARAVGLACVAGEALPPAAGFAPLPPHWGSVAPGLAQGHCSWVAWARPPLCSVLWAAKAGCI